MPTKLLPTAKRSPAPGRAIGAMIRARREARGWSQHDLARQTGLAETFISRVERGKVANPYRSTLEKFGQALGLQVADFYGEADAIAPLMIETPEDFGTWLRRMIATRGFATDRDFAHAIELHPGALSQILSGDVARPKYQTLWRIADVLNVPLAEIMARATRATEHGADGDRRTDRATRELFALLDALRDDGEVLAQLDALGTLDQPLLRDVTDLLRVYFRAALRERAARPLERALAGVGGNSACSPGRN